MMAGLMPYRQFQLNKRNDSAAPNIGNWTLRTWLTICGTDPSIGFDLTPLGVKVHSVLWLVKSDDMVVVCLTDQRRTNVDRSFQSPSSLINSRSVRVIFPRWPTSLTDRLTNWPKAIAIHSFRRRTRIYRRSICCWEDATEEEWVDSGRHRS